MTNNLLLATFLKKEKTQEFIKYLNKNFSVKKENIFIFSINEGDSVMMTYKIGKVEESMDKIKSKLKGTIQIHKKGNCFYSINGLNKTIERDFNLQGGNIQYKNYTIDWEKYQNKLLLVKDNNLHIEEIKKIILQ